MNRSENKIPDPPIQNTTQSEFHFNGFPQRASYTYTPDFMMDCFPAVLSSGEIRVVDYLFRRNSLQDLDISLTQMQNGLVTRGGKRLDYGCGLTKPSIIKALKGLESKGIIQKRTKQGDDGRHLTNTYQLNYDLDGWKKREEFEKFVGDDQSIDLNNFEFEGFEFPSFTPVPDVVYDLLPAVLSSGAYLVLRYICRHTFGYKKREDNISISQMLNGVTSRKGYRVDFGSGIKGRATIVKAIKELEALKIIQKTKNKTASGRNFTTTFSLIFKKGKQASTPSKEIELPLVKGLNNPSKEIELPLVKGLNNPSKEIELPLVKKLNPQKTVKQKTEVQKTVKQQQVNPNGDFVVVALVDFGFSELLARELAQGRSLEYVQEKLEIFEFIDSIEPEKIRNKLGWVRIALEQDYQKPSNFKSVTDIAAEQEAKRIQREQWDQQTQQIQHEVKHERTATSAKNKQEQTLLLQAGRKRFGTNQEDIDAWDSIKELIFLNEDELINNLCALKINSKNGSVTIGVLNEKIYQRVAHDRFKKRLKADIGRFLKSEIYSVELVLLDLEGEAV